MLGLQGDDAGRPRHERDATEYHQSEADEWRRLPDDDPRDEDDRTDGDDEEEPRVSRYDGTHESTPRPVPTVPHSTGTSNDIVCVLGARAVSVSAAATEVGAEIPHETFDGRNVNTLI